MLSAHNQLLVDQARSQAKSLNDLADIVEKQQQHIDALREAMVVEVNVHQDRWLRAKYGTLEECLEVMRQYGWYWPIQRFDELISAGRELLEIQRTTNVLSDELGQRVVKAIEKVLNEENYPKR